MPELTARYSAEEVGEAFRWAAGVGATVRLSRMRDSLRVTCGRVKVALGALCTLDGDYDSIIGVLSVAEAGDVRRLHVCETLEEAIKDLEEFIEEHKESK